jgi:myosin heavy subunit
MRHAIQRILDAVDVDPATYSIGRSMVFLKGDAMSLIESKRRQVMAAQEASHRKELEAARQRKGLQSCSVASPVKPNGAHATKELQALEDRLAAESYEHKQSLEDEALRHEQQILEIEQRWQDRMKAMELAWHGRMEEAELSWQSRIDVADQSARKAASVTLAEEKAKMKGLSDELCQLRSVVDTYKVGMESERGRTEVLVQEKMASYQVAMVGSYHLFSLDNLEGGLCLIQVRLFSSPSLSSPTAGESGAVWTLQRFGNSVQWSNRPRPPTRSLSRGIREDDL